MLRAASSLSSASLSSLSLLSSLLLLLLVLHLVLVLVLVRVVVVVLLTLLSEQQLPEIRTGPAGHGPHCLESLLWRAPPAVGRGRRIISLIIYYTAGVKYLAIFEVRRLTHARLQLHAGKMLSRSHAGAVPRWTADTHFGFRRRELASCLHSNRTSLSSVWCLPLHPAQLYNKVLDAAWSATTCYYERMLGRI